jgi:hypothetical protein
MIILELGVSQTTCLGWPQIAILPRPASQEAKITRHATLAENIFLEKK